MMQRWAVSKAVTPDAAVCGRLGSKLLMMQLVSKSDQHLVVL
jgi:hypothetical protein